MLAHMVARAACREGFVRFGALVALACVGGMTIPEVAAQPSGEPVRDADAAIARTRELVDPIKRCKPADDGSITVCGSDTERYRLTPEQRAIAGVGQKAEAPLPRAEARAMSLDRLPYNWVSIGKGYPPGPEYNALYELAKERTAPEADAEEEAETP